MEINKYMSTSAVITEPNTLATLPISSEILSYTAIVTLDAAGKIVKKGLNTSAKKVATLEAPGYTGPEQIAYKQSVSRPVVGTMEGFDSLFPDLDSKLFIINYGCARFADAKARAVMLETNDDDTELTFQPTDGTFDLTPEVQNTPARKLTNEEITINNLRKMGVSDDVIRSVFASLAAAKSQAITL
jgi:hypothetical protein